MNAEPNLHHANDIILRRVRNGWEAFNKQDENLHDHARFVFESTESLQKNLVRLIGHANGWVAEKSTPKRDDKGHFVKTK